MVKLGMKIVQAQQDSHQRRQNGVEIAEGGDERDRHCVMKKFRQG